LLFRAAALGNSPALCRRKPRGDSTWPRFQLVVPRSVAAGRGMRMERAHDRPIAIDKVLRA